MLLYYITDRSQFSGDEIARRDRLFEKIAEAAESGVDYIQLREKDLTARELEEVASRAAATIRESSPAPSHCTRLVVNSRSDVALAVSAEGVHLPSGDILPEDVRRIWKLQERQEPVISVACHSSSEVAAAAACRADLALFAPVFEKAGGEKAGGIPAGLASLREACRNKIRVLALGGVTVKNAHACMEAGAAGIAAIRLFQENKIAEIADAVRTHGRG